MKIAPEIVELSKVYKNDNADLNDKYAAFVKTIDYERLYHNIVKEFNYLRDGAEYGDWNSGTTGWGTALIETVGEDKCIEIFGNLDWCDCDYLDGAIEEELDKWFTENKNRIL